MRSEMEFRSEHHVSEFLDPRRGFERVRMPVEVRWDPLTGRTCRLLPEGSVPPPFRHDLLRLAGETQAACPFCAGALEEQTPRFAPELVPEGRIRRGEAVLFPNLVPYARWASVSVYSAQRHVLALEEITPRLLADNLAAQVAFARAVRGHDPEAAWISVNANHLPPSGSSVLHPHLQGTASPVGSTEQRLLAAVAPEAVGAYVARERDAGERHVASSGGVEWLASFAPLGPGEIRGFVPDAVSPAELDEARVEEVARGIAVMLRVYADLGFESFNLAVYGLPPGTPFGALLVRLVARAYIGTARRSDAMWSERLHGDAATDLAPERVAALARATWAARRAPVSDT